MKHQNQDSNPSSDTSVINRVGLLRPLRIKDFRYLWAGLTVSMIGDGIYLVALAWQVYRLSNAPSALSLVGVAWTLPMVFFLMLGGVLTDRIDRRLIMIASDMIRGLAIATMGILSVTGVLELWHLYVLVVFVGIGESLFGPSFGAIVPDLVPSDLLTEANSLDQFLRPATLQFAGPAVGGLLIHGLGVGTSFLLDAGTFGVSAIFLALMSTRPGAGRREEASVLGDIKEGFAFVRSQTWLWATLLAASVSLLCFWGPQEVLLPYLVKNPLHGDASDLGFILATGGLGSIIAALVTSQRGLPRRFVLFMYLMWSIAIGSIALYGLATRIWHLMLACLIEGLGAAAGMVTWTTMMHRMVPRSLLGRVSSLDWFISISLVPVSYAVTGPLAGIAGPRPALIGAGLAGGLLTLAFLAIPHLRDPERDPRMTGGEPEMVDPVDEPDSVSA